jgi:hypothetical protein
MHDRVGPLLASDVHKQGAHTMFDAPHLPIDLLAGVVGCLLWLGVVLLGRWNSTSTPMRGPRFRLEADGGCAWASDVEALEAALEQRKGQFVTIHDTVLERTERVTVAMDGTVWEACGSRHRFHVADRYENLMQDTRPSLS